MYKQADEQHYRIPGGEGLKAVADMQAYKQKEGRQ